ncbi:hypothetical protein MNBD_GAMMA12-1144 [hydrothermal vent metagenome]|uniref:Helix-turn-helix domain-containing protein n=1 Tax=hydrothermal vent metagenome TaxID=652676 RepID=A0A3B0YS12_9ZZZZ
MTNKRFLTTTEAAHYIGMSKAFLERDRWAGARIPFVRMGSRAIRYDIEMLDQYINSMIRKNTIRLRGGQR